MSSKGPLTAEERAAYFSKPPPKMPNSTIGWVVLCCVLLSAVGLLVDHFVNLPAATVAMPSVAPPTPSPVTTASHRPAVSGSGTAAMMDLERTDGAGAPPFVLRDAHGSLVSLASFRHEVVVLSFFDATCNDICPVLVRELEVAAATLRSRGLLGHVAFVAVNTDPLAVGADGSARGQAALRAVPNSVFLTGSLPMLNRVWSAYGVTVEAQPASGTVSHSELLYFVSKSGVLKARATPFGNEVGTRYELPSSTVHQFGRGIAAEVEQLITAT